MRLPLRYRVAGWLVGIAQQLDPYATRNERKMVQDATMRELRRLRNELRASGISGQRPTVNHYIHVTPNSGLTADEIIASVKADLARGLKRELAFDGEKLDA